MSTYTDVRLGAHNRDGVVSVCPRCGRRGARSLIHSPTPAHGEPMMRYVHSYTAAGRDQCVVPAQSVAATKE